MRETARLEEVARAEVARDLANQSQELKRRLSLRASRMLPRKLSSSDGSIYLGSQSKT